MSTIKTWQELLEQRIGDGQITTNNDVRFAMLDHIDALNEALKVAQAEIGELPEIQAMLLAENKALQVKLSAIEAQEPVGTVVDPTYVAMDKQLPYGTKLYAAHVAPAQQSAERTLTSLGYTNLGGEYWKPPLGKVRDARNAIAQAQPAKREPLIGCVQHDCAKCKARQSNAERVPIDCRQCGHFNNLKSKCTSTVSCKSGDMFYDGGFVPLYAEAEITKGQQ